MNAEEYATYMVEGGVFEQSKINNDWDGVTDTNWADVVFGKGQMQKHNVSFSNGNEKGTIIFLYHIWTTMVLSEEMQTSTNV